MGVSRNGPQGEHSGKVGKIVYYMLNGQQVSRTVGYTIKPATASQLSARLMTKTCNEFLSRFKEFINVGFGVEASGTVKNAFNLAVQYNRRTIIKGVYPDFGIDYEKVILSAGTLKPAENWHVTETGQGMQYNWGTDPQMAWPESTDQVMMLAYFPEQQKVIYTLFGSSRLSGSDVLEIPEGLQGKHAETFMSFVSADRKRLANSVYTGSFNNGLLKGLLTGGTQQ
ncbi:DUF6266 family protein [Pedobacter ginsengisoli]|uniref:DUF6266 family protein n=1 Tax=Pedobacter ginsengisoli TaxID=363852 RepID=UPI002549CF05|nr:DUF6266 family protein [Pedobacter ginsengisoli]